MRLEPRAGALSPLDDGLTVDWRIAWRAADPALETDARDLWADLGVIPKSADLELRVKELNVCAYVDGALAGVSTAGLRDLPFLKARFAMHRCVVAPPYRRRNLSRWINVASIDALEDWSAANPSEKVMGVATIVQSEVVDHHRPVWASGLTLVGHTAEGHQIRVLWFGHGRVG